MKKLRTPYEIKSEMGKALLVDIKEKDPSFNERKRTNASRNNVYNKYGKHCIICGRKGHGIKTEIAHILSIKEGGITNENNLVPLCSRKNRFGCHQLYDDGYLSRKELKVIAKKFLLNRVPNPKIRQKMIVNSKKIVDDTARPFPNDVNIPKIGNAAYLGGRTKAVEILKSSLEKAEKRDYKSEFFHRLRLAEFFRRGRGAKQLTKAFYEIRRCQELLKVVPEPYHSLFYYEYGYIKYLMGELQKAISSFNISAKIANNSSDKYSKIEEIAAIAQAAVVEIIGYKLKGSKAINYLEPIENRLQFLEEKAHSINSVIGNRWVINCILHQANVNIKMRRIAKAKQLFINATNFRDSLDASSGWTKSSVPYILRTRLLLEFLDENKKDYTEENYNHLIGMCCRALRTMVLGHDNWPEGIKDVIIAFRCLLQKEKKPKNACINKLYLVENNLNDPTSGFLQSSCK